MELAQYLLDSAKDLLQREGDAALPQKLANSHFFLANATDRSVMAFGVIAFNGVEYKIGPKT